MKDVNESLIEHGTLWLPRSASTFSNSIDSTFNIITWSSIFMFVCIVAVGIYFIIKYRRTPSNQQAASQVIHNSKLELVWTVIPLVLLIALFFWGYKDYLNMAVPPANAMEIRVIGKKWLWQFEYPKQGVKTLNEIVVPVNQPVKLIMSSDDVIHSFYIPNFRVKKDVLPNRYSRLWFEATSTGNYQIFCTEYCGDGHSGMLANLKVLSQEEYDDWLKNGSSGDDLPLDKLGEKLYTANACATCHSLDGSSKTGPTWKGLYGKKREFQDGSSAIADDDYIRNSINKPNLKVVKGYAPVMPSYEGLLNERQINGIIEYIKTLK